MFKKILPSVLMLLGLGCAGFADVSADFREANQFYDRENYSAAKQAYESIEQTGERSAALYYNMGNAEFRLNHPGAAILDYERALALEPSHPEARANLALVREKTGAKTAPRTWLDHLFPPFSLNQYAIAAAIAGWVLLFCLVAMPFNRRKSAGLWYAAVPALLLLGYTAGAVCVRDGDRALAIVTDEHAKARFAPADNSTLADALPVGSRVKILRDRGAWIYCALPNGNTAWIPAGSIEPIRPVM